MTLGGKKKKKCFSCFLLPTWAAVFDGYEGREVLRVVSEHDGVLVALCGRPLERQVDPAHVQRRDGGARLHTADHLVCFRSSLEAPKDFFFLHVLCNVSTSTAHWKGARFNTCDDDDGPAENVGQDEDVDVLQGVELEAVAAGDWGGHLHNLFPLLLPVLEQQTRTHSEKTT